MEGKEAGFRRVWLEENESLGSSALLFRLSVKGREEERQRMG